MCRAGLEGAALVVVVGVLVTALAGQRAGALGAGVVATTLAVQIFARAAHPEMAVVLAVIAAELLICLWFVRHTRAAPSAGLALLIGVAMGFGILAKGPVAVALPTLMTVVAAVAAPWVITLRGRWGSVWRDVAIVAVTAFVIAAPWFAAMTIRHGWDFLREALWQQNVVRYTSEVHRHRASVLFFVLPTLVGPLPWTAFLPAAGRRVVWRPRTPRELLRTCAAMAAATSFVFYSIAASKLANYALVIVPPLAILIALQLDDRVSDEAEGRSRWVAGWSERVTSAMLIAIGIAMLAVPWLLQQGVLRPRDLFGGVPQQDQDLVSACGRPRDQRLRC